MATPSLENINLDYLKSILEYNPITGNLIWKLRPVELFGSSGSHKAWNTRYSGKFAGCNSQGYVKLCINGSLYLAHRVCYFIFHGETPRYIDHIDGDGSNNKIENLRSVTIQENSKNIKIPKDNSSGFIGVSWNKGVNKWTANITSSGKDIYLGCFENIEDAILARKAANLKYGFHANHGER